MSIYACTMCGNKDINRRILLTLNCIICGNICVLSFFFFVLLKTKNFCIIMCKNSQLDRVIPKGNRKIKFLTPYVPILSFIMVRFKQLIKIKTRDTCKIFERINHLLLKKKKNELYIHLGYLLYKSRAEILFRLKG